MNYSIIVSEDCEQSIEKLCKKNPVLRNVLEKKMKEILEHPEHYKPLRYGLAGERRVHILKSFVLKYEINKQSKTVLFLFFGNHDQAYKR